VSAADDASKRVRTMLAQGTPYVWTVEEALARHAENYGYESDWPHCEVYEDRGHLLAEVYRIGAVSAQLEALVRAALLASRNQGETWGSRGGSSYYSTEEDVAVVDAEAKAAAEKVMRAIASIS